MVARSTNYQRRRWAPTSTTKLYCKPLIYNISSIPVRRIHPGSPSHWIFLDNKKCDGLRIIKSRIFTGVCLVAFGHSSLQYIWECSHPGADEALWKEARARVQRRHEIITITAGLLLATIANFLSTTPPAPSLSTYTRPGPYTCLIIAFGADLGGLVVGSAMLFVITECQRDWFRETLMGSRSNICCILALMAYPFVSIGIATVVFAIGLVIPAVWGDDVLIRATAVLLLLAPVTVIPLFCWPVLSKAGQRVENESAGAHSRV